MRTVNATLVSAQATGYPAGVYQSAVRCIPTSKDGLTTYDYSFDPTVTTNRLLHIQQTEVEGNDQGVILLSNHDRGVASDLRGYYVDIGWGLNTSAGILNTAAAGAVSPRMWVMQQQEVSGAPKGQKPQLYTVLEMAGVWRAILNCQPIRIGTSPYYRDNRNDPNEASPYTIAALTDKTIYGVLEYLIETTLSAQTGYTFTLAALSQDDGLINSIVPFPTDRSGTMFLNMDTPREFDTYGKIISQLMAQTKSLLRPKAALDFEIVYPQTADAVNETYYSSLASGHPYYEVTDVKVNKQSDGSGLPNHIEVYGSSNPGGGVFDDVLGEWYDPTHYTGTTYTGPFMSVTKTYQQEGIAATADATDLATALGRQIKDGVVGSRVIVQMDARVELYDRISVQDAR